MKFINKQAINLIIMLGLICGVAVDAVQAELQNGNFEIISTKGIAKSWYFENWAKKGSQISLTADKELKVAGRQSVKIMATPGRPRIVLLQDLKITDNTKYLLSAMVRGRGAYLELIFLDGKNKLARKKSDKLTGLTEDKGGFEALQVSLQAPAGSSSVRVLLFGQGTAWFDNVILKIDDRAHVSNDATVLDDENKTTPRVSQARPESLNSAIIDKIIVLEAESATDIGGAEVADDKSGFSGTGFVDYVDATGAYAKWEVDLPNGGDYNIIFGYALASGDRPLSISINGKIIKTKLSFSATGSFTTWAETTALTVSLNSGINTIQATSVGASGANVDYLKLIPCSVDNAAIGSVTKSLNTATANIISESEKKKFDTTIKAKMSPAELKWELILEANLDEDDLSRYKKAKIQGKITAWDFVKDVAHLPRILIIGDSISCAYTSSIRKILAGEVNVHRAPANCKSTKLALKKLDIWLENGPWDFIYFNFGICNNSSSPEDYIKDLEKIIIRLQKVKTRLVWISSTPLNGGKKYPKGAMEKLNQAAFELMNKYDIPTIDLYVVAKKLQGSDQTADGCHYTSHGYNSLAQHIAKKIKNNL